MIQRSREIGAAWRDKIEDLKWESRESFYLYPESTDGLSDSSRAHRSTESKIRFHKNARIGDFFHRNFVSDESKAGRFLRNRISSSRENEAKSKFWDSVLQLATGYRKLALGCVGCGDCIQDYLDYSGCTMRWCYKNLRNGPCGGSRQDGSCEADPNQYCIWNTVYENTVSAGGNPRKFAETLIPPRDWCLDQTNALANRLAGLDNYCHRKKLEIDKIT
jgi:methylenetetrahydrofolate reductase (NADPH)